jgi:cytochrome c oxidase subunit 2
MYDGSLPTALGSVALQAGRTPGELFNRIYDVFLWLGTAVGVVVVAYLLYNAYRYRDGADRSEAAEADRPTLGEVPTGGGQGRKLAVSLFLSAVIVVSLIVWTYTSLLYFETAPDERDDALEVRVEGYQFGWEFVYPNGHRNTTLRVPRGRMVELTVTSRDVFHNFGVPAFKIKADAIPGQTTDTWFVANRTGTFRAQCYELCGAGHSYMHADVVVMEPAAYEVWYADAAAGNATGDGTTTASSAAAMDGAATDGDTAVGDATAASAGGAP